MDEAQVPEGRRDVRGRRPQPVAAHLRTRCYRRLRKRLRGQLSDQPTPCPCTLYVYHLYTCNAQKPFVQSTELYSFMGTCAVPTSAFYGFRGWANDSTFLQSKRLGLLFTFFISFVSRWTTVLIEHEPCTHSLHTHVRIPTLRDDRPTLFGRHRLMWLAATEPSTEPTWLGLKLGLKP